MSAHDRHVRGIWRTIILIGALLFLTGGGITLMVLDLVQASMGCTS